MNAHGRPFNPSLTGDEPEMFIAGDEAKQTVTRVRLASDRHGQHPVRPLAGGAEPGLGGLTLASQGRILLDSAGAWELWPCYELSVAEAGVLSLGALRNHSHISGD